jgi:hypothetical protein
MEPIGAESVESLLAVASSASPRDVEISAIDLSLFDLTELHLPAMRACFEESARRAEKETLSYEQHLLELTGRECEA